MTSFTNNQPIADNWYSTASTEERANLRQWLWSVLAENTLLVDFVKANGTRRTMRVTLIPSKLPPPKENASSTSINSDAAENCVVWDCDAHGWRSFRYDRLRLVEFVDLVP